MQIEGVTYWVLAAALFPLWLAAGVADYLCHRQTRIEHTSGLTESASHIVLASLMGTGVLMLMFLELNVLLLSLLAVLFIAHEIVTYLDLAWSAPRREVSPVEQQVHALLEAVPFATLVALAIVVFSARTLGAALALRANVDLSAISVMLCAMALFGALPFWEEFWRCWRARGSQGWPRLASSRSLRS
jgi:hypothetical protein